MISDICFPARCFMAFSRRNPEAWPRAVSCSCSELSGGILDWLMSRGYVASRRFPARSSRLLFVNRFSTFVLALPRVVRIDRGGRVDSGESGKTSWNRARAASKLQKMTKPSLLVILQFPLNRGPNV